MTCIDMQAVRAYHDGQLQAQRLLDIIRCTTAAPDLLHDTLPVVLAASHTETLRGFCREVQKALERTR